MKMLLILSCVLFSALGAFAYDDYNHSNYNDQMSGFSLFILFVMIAYIILSIVVLMRWWKMTNNIDQIRQHLTHANPKLTYLVAIGEKGQAEKAALTILVDLLYPVYTDQYELNKAETMNQLIESHLPKIKKLGLSLPDYVTSGEKFIDYMNSLTDCKVPYKEGGRKSETSSDLFS